MQLYAVTKQVCWHHPEQFHNVFVHPGGMHIIQSFIGCIAKLMKGSSLEVYVAAAYGGLTGMYCYYINAMILTPCHYVIGIFNASPG